MPLHLDSYLLGYLHAHKSYDTFSCKNAAFLATLRDELSLGTLNTTRSSGQNTLKFSAAEQAELAAASRDVPNDWPDLCYLAGALDAKGTIFMDGPAMRVSYSRVHRTLAKHLHAFSGKRKTRFYGMDAARLLEQLVPFLRLKRAKAQRMLGMRVEATENPLRTIAEALDMNVVYENGESFTIAFRNVTPALMQHLHQHGEQHGNDYHYVDHDADRVLQLLIPHLDAAKREVAYHAREWWEYAQVK